MVSGRGYGNTVMKVKSILGVTFYLYVPKGSTPWATASFLHHTPEAEVPKQSRKVYLTVNTCVFTLSLPRQKSLEQGTATPTCAKYPFCHCPSMFPLPSCVWEMVYPKARTTFALSLAKCYQQVSQKHNLNSFLNQKSTGASVKVQLNCILHWNLEHHHALQNYGEERCPLIFFCKSIIFYGRNCSTCFRLD